MTARHANTTPRLSTPVAFGVQISIVVALYAASSAPSPLYAVYQAQWGYSSITTTVVFAAYCIAVLLSLLVFGSLSDYVGRRPVLIVALLVQAAAMVIFAVAGGVTELFAARFVQGLSTGAAIGPVGAGMIDFYKQRGVVANAGMGPIGAGIGALTCGFFVDYLPLPTHLIYIVFAVLFVAQAAATYFMAETVTRRPGARAALRPQFGLPKAVRGSFLIAAPVLDRRLGAGRLVRSARADPGPNADRKRLPCHGRSRHRRLQRARWGVGARPEEPAGPTDDDLRRPARSSSAWPASWSRSTTDRRSASSRSASSRAPDSAAGIRPGSAASCRMSLPTNGPVCCRSSTSSPTWPWESPSIALGFRVVHAGVLESTSEFGIGAIVLVSIALVGTLFRRAPAPVITPAAETELVVEPA